MKREKALLEIDGELLIERIARVLRPIFSEIVVVTPKPEVAQAANLPLFPTDSPIAGRSAAFTRRSNISARPRLSSRAICRI
jgi:molybdopterin-guanine dinucleotide biosynthesis protein A